MAGKLEDGGYRSIVMIMDFFWRQPAEHRFDMRGMIQSRWAMGPGWGGGSPHRQMTGGS